MSKSSDGSETISAPSSLLPFQLRKDPENIVAFGNCIQGFIIKEKHRVEINYKWQLTEVSYQLAVWEDCVHPPRWTIPFLQSDNVTDRFLSTSILTFRHDFVPNAAALHTLMPALCKRSS